MPGGIYRERMSILAWVICLAAIIAGLVCIGLSEYLRDSPYLHSFLSNAGGVFIGSGGVGLIWELFAKRAFVEEIFEATGVAQQVQAAKVLGVTTNFKNGVAWAEYIGSAKTLDIMVFGAKTWRNYHDKSLLELAKKPGARINLILPDPGNERVVRELSDRFNYTKQLVGYEISEAETFFKNLVAKAGSGKSILKIYYMCEAPLYTFYRLDNVYVLATYRHNRKGDVATVVCSKGGSVADFLDEQIDSMIGKGGMARQVYPPKDQTSRDEPMIRDDASSIGRPENVS